MAPSSLCGGLATFALSPLWGVLGSPDFSAQAPVDLSGASAVLCEIATFTRCSQEACYPCTFLCSVYHFLRWTLQICCLARFGLFHAERLPSAVLVSPPGLLFWVCLLHFLLPFVVPRSAWALPCGEVDIPCPFVPPRSTLLGLPATLSLALSGASLRSISSMRSGCHRLSLCPAVSSRSTLFIAAWDTFCCHLWCLARLCLFHAEKLPSAVLMTLPGLLLLVCLPFHGRSTHVHDSDPAAGSADTAHVHASCPAAGAEMATTTLRSK